MVYCCTNCFENKFIKDFIEQHNEIKKCDYCSAENCYTLDTAIVGDFIRECLSRAYENIDESRIYWDSEKKEYTGGDSIFEILAYDEGIFSEEIYNKNSESKLFYDLFEHSGPSVRDIQQGEIDHFEGGDALIVLRHELYGYDDNRFSSSWDKFKYICKHYSRYFDLGDNSSTREQLLSVVSELIERESLKITLNKGENIYRARVIDNEINLRLPALELQKEIGPPPNTIVKNNRMSPPGISYFYGAKEIETCLAEIRPPVGSNVLVGEFKLTQNLNLLDLSNIPNITVRSIFDPEYDHEMIWAQYFIESFIKDITKPMKENNESIEYVPTQVLAEYIRKKGYQGIKYESSQLGGGPELTLYEKISNFNIHHFGNIASFTNLMSLKFARILKVERIEFGWYLKTEQSIDMEEV